MDFIMNSHGFSEQASYVSTHAPLAWAWEQWVTCRSATAGHGHRYNAMGISLDEVCRRNGLPDYTGFRVQPIQYHLKQYDDLTHESTAELQILSKVSGHESGQALLMPTDLQAHFINFKN